MRYSIKIPLIITLFYAVTIIYTFVQINSYWVDVFWACYKNLMIMACLYIIYKNKLLIWVDRFFIASCMIVNIIQSCMYLLCPFSTDDQKLFYFKLFGWFVILISTSCIIIYIKELLGGNGN